MTIEISIVGIKNYITQKLEDFYSSAPGKDVIIKLEPGNVYDPKAVVTLLDGKPIGYVRKSDVVSYGLFTLLMGEKRNCYTAKILHKSEGFDSLVARLSCDKQLIAEKNMQELHRRWKYSALVLSPVKMWVELEDVMDSIMTLLESGTANVTNLQSLMERYFELVRYGFSKEFKDDRLRLYDMLKKHHDEGVRNFAKLLEEISKEIHMPEVRSKAYSKIIKEMKKQIAREYADDALQQVVSNITREMESFPSNLYEKRRRMQAFPCCVYYEQMPREVLLKFMSGMALVGYLGELEKKGFEKPKKKPGRPRKKAEENSLQKRIVGASHRDYWMDHIRRNLQGKDNMRAGYVMCAYVYCGVLDSAPYGEVKSSFGNIGTEEYYNKGFKNPNAFYPTQYAFLCEQIEADKKALVQALTIGQNLNHI